MVKDHSGRERENLLPPLHGLLFPISSKSYFICTIPQTGYHIPRSLLHQLLSTGWSEKEPYQSDDPEREREGGGGGGGGGAIAEGLISKLKNSKKYFWREPPFWQR